MAPKAGVLVPPTPDTKFALVIFFNAPEADVSDNKIKSSPVLKSVNSAVIVIHLERATQRQANVEQIFHTIDQIDSLKTFHKHQLIAVDGKQLSAQDREKYYQPGLYTPHPFLPDDMNLSNNLIACFLSHRKAWQYIVDNNLDSGLIIEDDVKINPNLFKNALKIGFENLRKNLLIRFKFLQLNKIDLLFNFYHNGSFIRFVAPTGMQSYLISKETAKKLLDLTTTFDRSVDEYLKLTKVTGIYSAEVYPTGVTEISDQLGGSNIGYYDKKTNFSFLEKILLEFKRVFYKLQLLDF